MTFAYKCVNVSNSIGDLDFRNKLDGKIPPIFKKIAIANKLEKRQRKEEGKKGHTHGEAISGFKLSPRNKDDCTLSIGGRFTPIFLKPEGP